MTSTKYALHVELDFAEESSTNADALACLLFSIAAERSVQESGIQITYNS